MDGWTMIMGSAAGDLICHLQAPNNPKSEGSLSALCLRTLTSLLTDPESPVHRLGKTWFPLLPSPLLIRVYREVENLGGPRGTCAECAHIHLRD